MIGNRREGHGARAERQGRGYDDETHGLVEDHGFQSWKREEPNQQRQAKFRTAESNHAAERTNGSAAAERRDKTP